MSSIQDGLDALIRPHSNVFDVEWLAGYEGALTLVVGTRHRVAPDEEVAVSYRYDLPDNETFRVRHRIDTTLLR